MKEYTVNDFISLANIPTTPGSSRLLMDLLDDSVIKEKYRQKFGDIEGDEWQLPYEEMTFEEWGNEALYKILGALIEWIKRNTEHNKKLRESKVSNLIYDLDYMSSYIINDDITYHTISEAEFKRIIFRLVDKYVPDSQ